MDFLIVPSEQPDWSVTRAALEQQVRGRWPDAGCYETAADSPMVVTVVLPYPQGDLQVDLSRRGTMLSLEAPDLASAADFAAWWARLAPGLEPDLRIYVTADFDRSVALRRDISAGEIRAALAP